jgi:hypothetical protein
MIDREKVVSVLLKRFPTASPHEVAAAANAIVGLSQEYVPVDPIEISSFTCVTDDLRFTADDVGEGRVRVFRRVDEG